MATSPDIRSTRLFGAGLPLALVSSVGDPEGTRTITAIVALLAVLGIGLAMLAVWLFRVTRPDPELLAPLEVMGERKWRRADPVWQRRRLDEVRPDDAKPLVPSAAPPMLDEAFDQGPAGTGFDDLHEPVPAAAPVAAAGAAESDSTTAIAEAGDDVGVDDDEHDDDRGQRRLPFGEPLLRPRPHSSATPISMVRPTPEDLPPGDLDPDLMAAAMAELDAELANRRHDPEERLGGSPGR